MSRKTMHTIILTALHGEFADPQAEEYFEAAIENELDTNNYILKGGRWTIRTGAPPKQIMDFIEGNGYGFYDVISIDGQNWSTFYDSVIASIKTRNTKGADKMPSIYSQRKKKDVEKIAKGLVMEGVCTDYPRLCDELVFDRFDVDFDGTTMYVECRFDLSRHRGMGDDFFIEIPVWKYGINGKESAEEFAEFASGFVCERLYPILDEILAELHVGSPSKKMATDTREPAEDGKIHLSWGKVSDLFYEYNKLIDWNDYKAAIVAYVVYSNDTQSWRRHDYSLESRTYAFGSNNKAFIPGMGGYSIFAQNLDKTDFTRIEHMDWIIEDVYLDKSEYDRMMKVINAGARVKTQFKSKKPVRKTTTKRSVKK